MASTSSIRPQRGGGERPGSGPDPRDGDLVASLVSVEAGISVALIELALGVLVGKRIDNITIADRLSFVGSFASIVLTFLAGAEVDVAQLRREWKASASIGLVSFFGPFVAVGLLTYYGLGWNHRQAEIAGIALSTTSLAVVYAVLVETGLNRAPVGKRLMSATFVLVLGLPRLAPLFFGRYGNRVIEPEIKLAFAPLFLLMWRGDHAHSHAVLPAFVLGLVMSGH